MQEVRANALFDAADLTFNAPPRSKLGLSQQAVGSAQTAFGAMASPLDGDGQRKFEVIDVVGECLNLLSSDRGDARHVNSRETSKLSARLDNLLNILAPVSAQFLSLPALQELREILRLKSKIASHILQKKAGYMSDKDKGAKTRREVR